MRGALLALVVAPFTLAACGASPDPASSPNAGEETGSAALSTQTATTYVDVADSWTTSADQDAWFAAVASLKLQFENVCGDTFCSSDYSNFEPLELQCAVSSIRGSVKSCTWVFAASEAVVNGATGTVTASAPHYQCAFNPTGNARALATFFNQAGSLQATLPGLTQSLYDLVGECLQHPIGATPVPVPTTATYEDPANADNIDQGVWDEMTNTLSASFANVCGDTFCEGDYSNLTAFGFTCSVGTKSTKVHECRWVFAGSYSTVNAKTGLIAVNEKSSVCVIATHGTAGDLITTFGATGTIEPIQRTLPGETTSLYASVAKCL